MTDYPLSLTALKLNLGLRAPEDEQTAYLEGLLDTAAEKLRGAKLSPDDADAEMRNLLVVYAAWLYRSRATGAAKPPMLQLMINDAKTRQVQS